MTGFLGVIGGMGPLATADFLYKLVKRTPAVSEQEHIPILLHGDCTVPDRTANILGNGASPLPKLLEGIRFLNRNGVAAICIPCNSAHRWFDDMQEASDVPILHIVRASAVQVRAKKSGAKTIGVLSTFGTHRTGMYRNTLQAMGYNVVTPTDQEFEMLVSPAIAMSKANLLLEAEPYYEQAANKLIERGAEIIVLGCTEIPVGMERQMRANPAQFVDSNDALADSAVAFFAERRRQVPA
jgi:aspartate racemase